MKLDESKGTRPWAGTAMVVIALVMSVPVGILMFVNGQLLRGLFQLAVGAFLVATGLQIRRGGGSNRGRKTGISPGA